MNSATVSSAGLTKQRSFVLFWLARLVSTMGYQMLALTIGWQVYELTNSAFDLGLVGLIQFVPAVVLTLLIGHIADRYDRRLIVRGAHSVYAAAAVMIAAAFVTGALSRELLFTAVFIIGCARAFEMPTAHALAPTLVPQSLISRAVAAWNSANQTAVICGPALGGLIYALSPVLIGLTCLIFFACSITLVSLVRASGPAPSCEPPTFASVLAGFDYIRSRRRLLGVITLDLLVVILGGATALLPVYAPGHPGRRTNRSRASAFGTCRRRLDHVDCAGPASDRALHRPQNVRGGWDLRGGDNRVRAVDIVSPLAGGSCHSRRFRRCEHRYPLLACAD